MTTRGPYRIVGVASGYCREWTCTKAPSDALLCTYGRRTNVDFMIRYFPSKKGWVVLDIRKALPLGAGSHQWWSGQVRWEKVFPSEDAAVMVAMHQTGTTIEA